ncbi:phage tail assembly chaperone [Cupriavidus basilensis]|uniref:phage tail assembly chaperone n=1 Tax=Cupriavidus basilensis TaxID=68895 RepID=UPI00157B5E52|nr:tail fiber assembly protein [Cupriavidus basilensis]NUA26098.1 tail fiber assembly protein [Cupriavidus basilensis]
MEIFNYHPLTGEFLGNGVADENPLDVENPIVPGFATPTPPPARTARAIPVYRNAAGHAPQNWSEGSWTLAPDYRAEPLFRTADGSPFALGLEYTGLGDLPAFLTDEPRPSPAHKWVNEEWTLDAELETEQAAATVRARRDELLTAADKLIAPLMDGFVLGELTPEEDAKLKAMSQYRKALRAVTGQTGFPRTIDWPAKPA